MLAGRPYRRLIALNGKPLPEALARKEQEKMDREFAQRQHELAFDKAKREKKDAEDRKFLFRRRMLILCAWKVWPRENRCGF
jgi:hypothetical protein